MKFIKSSNLRVLLAVSVMVLALGVTNLAAQETTKISGKITAKYTSQDSMVVGDVDNHLISLSKSEGKNANTGENAFMDGAAIINMSYTDLTLGNGTQSGYIGFTQDGDGIYAKWKGDVKTVQTAEGAPSTSFEGTFTYIKGTGKFENISGGGTYKGMFISETEYSVDWQAEYLIEK